ncbi:MAG: hypothetical protein WCP20_01245 [Desulfuromonadales bacterium]
MSFLPKVNPLYEKISTTNVVISEVLEKLGKGGFTGYLSLTAIGFKTYCIFAKGKLLCAANRAGCRVITGCEAISQMFDKAIETGGEIDVYRMSTDLVMCSHALVAGVRPISGNEVRHVDIKAMMVRLKGEGLNGVVHFYTPEHYGMMFFKEGLPVGFYYDGSDSIESSSEEVRKVAALVGARVDVYTTKPIEELMRYDLLQSADLGKLWEAAKFRHASTHEDGPTVTDDRPLGLNDNKLAELVDDLIEVASAYLYKEGRGVIEKSIMQAGGFSILLDSATTETFLKQVETDARIIDSDARVGEMIDLMRSEIAGRFTA